MFTLNFVCLQCYIWSSFLYYVITLLYLFTLPYMVLCIYSILPVGRCPASSSHTSLGTLPYMEVWPRHCVVLHDIVAVLDDGYGGGDTLHISSTNLHSWTSTTLPYMNMSLTTYQDKLVAVGGMHPFTDEVTDQLLTSATGEDWQPSLPPMPTKRSRTSSVSAGSPEVIIVAGGRDSYRRDLHTVEVLLGDQWSTAHPLPTPCWDMRSSLHEGNIYFTGGVGKRNTIYTCSCTSLITSCGLTGNDTSTTTPVWRKLEASDDTAAIVSCSSRLITVDERCSIRGYSTMRQSWVETTSEGERMDEDTIGSLTAAVLPTGQLVVANGWSGVYRVTLSGECV